MAFLEKIFGSNERVVGKLRPLVEKVNAFEEEYKKLSDDDIKAKTESFKERIRKGETTDKLLPEAFALVREAAGRVIGERHYDVQMLGGVVLHQGKINENG